MRRVLSFLILCVIILSCSKDEQPIAEPEVKEYPLKINIIGEGKVEEEIISTTKSATTYDEGTVVKLTAISTDEWSFFEKWSGDVESDSTTIEITVDSPKEVTVTFNESNYIVKSNETTVSIPSIPNPRYISQTFYDVSGTFHYKSSGEEYMLFGGTYWSEDMYTGIMDVDALYNVPTLTLKRENDEWVFHRAYEDAAMLSPRNFKFIDANSFVISDAAEVGALPENWKGNIWYGRITGDNILWTKVNSEEHRIFYHGVTAGDINNDGLVDFGGAPPIKLFTQNPDGSFSNTDTLLNNVNNLASAFTLEFADVMGDERNEIITADYGCHEDEDCNQLRVFAFDDSTNKYEIKFLSKSPWVFFGWDLGATSIKVDDFNNDGNPDISIAREEIPPEDLTSVEVWLGDGNGKFTPHDAFSFTNNELQFREFSLMDANNDGFIDIILRPFHYGSLYRINPVWWQIDNTKGIKLNHLIWLNNGDGTFSYFDKNDLTLNGVILNNAYPFMRDGNLHFIGNTATEDYNQNVVNLKVFDIKVNLN